VAKALSREQAEAALREPKGFVEALRRPPDDVSVPLAAKVAHQLLKDRGWAFARSCQRLPRSVIVELLSLIAEDPPTAERIFLREFVKAESESLTEDWSLALRTLLDLDTTYAWGSKQRRAKLKAVASNPRALAAVQAAVVGAPVRRRDMLAVLAIDGSDASVDALMPVFTSAQADSWLADLETHAAKTPAIEALLASVSARREKKERESPALVFAAKALGLVVSSLKVRLSLTSRELNLSRVPALQGSLVIDSGRDDWWSIFVTSVGDRTALTTFSSAAVTRDDLELGRCALEDFPEWLATAQKKLKCQFEVREPRGSLRGKKRTQFADWAFQRIR
jgi:hypothetical protein